MSSKPDPRPSPYVSRREAAYMLGCSMNHVSNLADLGEIGSLDLSSPKSKKAYTRFSRESIAAYILKRST